MCFEQLIPHTSHASDLPHLLFRACNSGTRAVFPRTLQFEQAITGDVVMKNTATVDGNALVKKDLTVNENALVKKDLTVNENATIKKSLTVEENATVEGNLTIEGELKAKIINNDFVINTTTTDYSVIIAEDLSINGGLIVKDDASFNRDVNIANDLNVYNDLVVWRILVFKY